MKLTDEECTVALDERQPQATEAEHTEEHDREPIKSRVETVARQPEQTASRTKQILQTVLDQWFILGFAIVIVVSYAAPDVAQRQGYLASEYTFSYGALALIFLISGLTMPTKVLWDNLHRWRIHLYTQSVCFIITPLFGLAIVQCILASGNKDIPDIVLAGIVIMLCTPTTVASNITFTRAAGGDDAAALIEVTIGNLLGIFITPALVQLFLRPSIGLGAAAPTQSPGSIYTELIKHFGLALYLPLFVGQGVQNIWPERVKWLSKLLYLPKWGSVCLLLLLWETFSDAFGSGAFSAIPPKSVILVVFLNLGLYPFFTAVCFVMCRPPGRDLRRFCLTKPQTIAVCFCGPPKSITVGLVLIIVQYSNFSVLDQAIIVIPLSLYQGMQIFVAQGFVILFRRWGRLEESTY